MLSGLLLFFIVCLNAQSVGLRFNSEVANEPLTRSAYGVGLYFNTYNSSCHLELVISGDYNRNTQEHPDDDGCSGIGFNSSYVRISGAVGTQYRFEITPQLSIKTGVGAYYELAQISEIGRPSNWISGHSKYLTGPALIAALRYRSIFNSDFNLDCFLFPQYGFIVSGAKDPSVFRHPVYFHGFRMNAQVGISYSVDQL